MSNKYEYSDEMIERMKSVAANGVSEDVIESLVEELGHPRRSVTAKLRKLGFEVPKKAGEAPVFSAEETAALAQFLTEHAGEFTAEEIASQFAGGKFNARQINGKALSQTMTDKVKPADKKVAPKTYTEAEEATITEMAGKGAFLEDIAEKLGKTANSVRGKLLSMQLKAPQRDKKGTKTDNYDGIEELAPKMSVAELATHFGKTERGVKTVLTRRGIAAKDHAPKAKAE